MDDGVSDVGLVDLPQRRSGRSEQALIEVLLCVERHDGNDPIEAVAHLPIVPRVGDMLAIWNPGGGLARREVLVEVEQVVLRTYTPDRIAVWVRMDGYDLTEIESAMSAVRRDEQP